MVAAMPALRGPAGCPPTFLSARKPPQNANFVTYSRFLPNHPLQQRGCSFPSVALRVQGLDRVPWSFKPLFSDADFVDPQAPTSYIDVLNTMKLRHPLEQKLLHKECQHCEKDLQQGARNFVDGIIQFISSEKDCYKFIIIACKESANMIMDLGFISSYNRDDILNGLGRIDDDIAKGKFQWRENKDVRNNIVEALVERVGEPARKLDATISQYVQNLTILRLWLHDSANIIVTLIEQLQVELVLLALRNWGFVVPLLFRCTDWILLGELMLSKVKMLEMDVLRLRSCKNKIDSTLRITFPLCRADGCLDRLSSDGPHLLQNGVIDFANVIIGDIAIDICTLEREICYWTRFSFLTPNDGVMESFSLLRKHVSDLSKITTIEKDPFSYYYHFHQERDNCQRFLAVYIIVQQILKAATDFAKYVTFDHKKVQSCPSFGYAKGRSSKVHMVKKILSKQVSGEDESKQKKDEGVRAAREFSSRSDEVMKKLVEWLAKHQTAENPLKFSQFD